MCVCFCVNLNEHAICLHGMYSCVCVCMCSTREFILSHSCSRDVGGRAFCGEKRERKGEKLARGVVVLFVVVAACLGIERTAVVDTGAVVIESVVN